MSSDKGQQRSIYGKADQSPEEFCGQWKQCVKKEDHIHEDHLAITGDGSVYWPGVEPPTEEELKQHLTYYCTPKQHAVMSSYDRMFHVTSGYNGKLHRDDRQHTVGLDVETEERERVVPVLSSTEYGRHLDKPLEEASRKYVRIDKVHKGFSRRSGIGIPTSMD